MLINNQTRLNIIIGKPLDHSQSPVLHDALYQLLDINAVLLAQPTLQLNSLMSVIKSLSIGLTAVTLPYKELVVQCVDACNPEVDALKAANTLIFRDDIIRGYNTDVDGIAFALRNISLNNKRIVIIGSGGAARAAGYFLQMCQSNMFFLNRSYDKAAALANLFGGNVISYSDLNSLNPDIIINATPIGMYPLVDASPLPDYNFNHDQIIFDMIYNPVDTTLIRQAQAKQATTISGLDMFIGQGIKQVELFLDKTIDASSMATKLRALLIHHQRVTHQ